MKFTDHERHLLLKAVEVELKFVEDESTTSNKYLRLFETRKNGEDMKEAVNAIMEILYSED